MKYLLSIYDEKAVPMTEDGTPLDVFDRINQSFMDMDVEAVMQEFSSARSAVDAVSDDIAAQGGSPAERLFLELQSLVDAVGASHDERESDLEQICGSSYRLLDELRASVLP